jgi:manganese/zinc/iron transport system permease protein
MYEIIEARLVSANDQSVTENGLNISSSLSGSEATEEESALFAEQAVQISELFNHRSWSVRRVRQVIAAAEREGTVRIDSETGWRLTRSGAKIARRAVRNHRLWEMYLISHAEIAPSHVDRDADDIEHVLGAEVIEQLEQLLASRVPAAIVPPSPHPL